MPRLKRTPIAWLAAGLAGLFLLAACTPATEEVEVVTTAAVQTTASVDRPTGTPVPTPEREYDIITLLPPDAILAINDPQFYDVIGADLEYDPDELVLGVELDGDARAYPIGVLAQREIINDTVGGQPIAVTY